jgi:hypothetical protein
MNATYRPLSSWPGDRTPASARRRSPFKASWPMTIEELDREVFYLCGRLSGRVLIEIGLEERHIRLDGVPRANAPQPVDPGVILSFPESKYGPLRYACDRFDRWQDNLRAIVLGLESLRRVERYGIAKRGEQYAGWKQLPAAGATGTRDEARAALLRYLRDDVRYVPEALQGLDDRGIARVALSNAHPDRGGDPDRFRDEILPAYQRLVGADA